MTQTALLQLCIDKAGGLGELSRISGTPITTLRDWTQGTQTFYSSLLQVAKSVGVDIELSFDDSLPLGNKDTNAEALRLIELRYNGFKREEVLKNLQAYYPNGCTIVDYEVKPKGEGLGWDVMGKEDVGTCYRNRLTIYDAKGVKFLGYYTF